MWGQFLILIWTLRQIKSILSISSPSTVLVNYLKDNGQFQNWGTTDCYGVIRNTICVWSLPDLPTILKNKTKYIINKFRSDVDPFIIECIRDNIRQREALES